MKKFYYKVKKIVVGWVITKLYFRIAKATVKLEKWKIKLDAINAKIGA
jgi:hypothetical protein